MTRLAAALAAALLLAGCNEDAPRPATPKPTTAQPGAFCRAGSPPTVDRHGQPLHCRRNGNRWWWTR